MHEVHGDDHITLLRQFHRPAFKIGSQVALGQSQQPDVVKQQIAGSVDRVAQFLDLLLGVAIQQFLAVDADFAQIGDQMVERPVRLFRVSFVAAVDGRFL